MRAYTKGERAAGRLDAGRVVREVEAEVREVLRDEAEGEAAGLDWFYHLIEQDILVLIEQPGLEDRLRRLGRMGLLR